jgi:hypothetical protein
LILPPDATYEQFEAYVTDLRGPKGRLELAELWEWRQKLLGVRVVTGRTMREMLPPDEQHLTLRQRERKVIAEARAAGIEPERAPA